VKIEREQLVLHTSWPTIVKPLHLRPILIQEIKTYLTVVMTIVFLNILKFLEGSFAIKKDERLRIWGDELFRIVVRHFQ
jgi:hypothetical protein